MGVSILQLTNLTCERHDRTLFSNLSFTLTPGQVLQVTGLNGSGKTTLLRILSGLTDPDEGEVRWQNKLLANNRSDYLSDLIYLGHPLSIKGELTARENLHMICALAKHRVMTSLSSALAQVGLLELADVFAHTLSAGQQRRLALARLLLLKARLWILDEPLTALDQQGVAIVEERVVKHVQQRGSVILTSHQPITFAGVSVQQVSL